MTDYVRVVEFRDGCDGRRLPEVHVWETLLIDGQECPIDNYARSLGYEISGAGVKATTVAFYVLARHAVATRVRGQTWRCTLYGRPCRTPRVDNAPDPWTEVVHHRGRTYRRVEIFASAMTSFTLGEE